MFKPELQAVIVGVSAVEGIRDVAEGGNGTVARQRSAGEGMRLIEVPEQQQFRRVVAYVSHVHKRVFGYFALRREKPALNVAGPVILGHIGHVGRERVEVAGQSNSSRIALICSAEGCSSRAGLVYNCINDLGTIDGQKIARAGPVVVDVADAIAAPNHGGFERGVGKAQAGSEVVPVRIDQGRPAMPLSVAEIMLAVAGSKFVRWLSFS